jgi:4-amino-4-deoxy-L-arabinose transferase-like glycosyltransferase
VTLTRPALVPRAVAILLVLSAALSLWTALRYPLLDPDEGRNAEVAREMAASGDVVIPHLAGMPYLDKPPLLFAAAAACIRVLGHTPLAARLPATVAALLTLLLLARASARLEPDGHATRAVALLAAAPLFAVLSAYVIFDMPLTLAVTVVWTGLAAEVVEGPRPGRRAAMWFAVALGVLAKGPVMLAWAIGGTLVAALVMRERAPLRWLAWAPGWAILIALAGGWFALALRRHPEYARYAFLEESLERMTSGSFRREQPVWFVPAVFAGGALPWSVVTPWRWPRSRASRIAGAFVLFASLFFTVSHSKLVTYLLPAFPALAWWAAECWGRGRPGLPRPLWTALLLAPALLVGGSPWLARYAETQSGAALAGQITREGGGTVVYEDCYSPGSDYRLGRVSAVVSGDGHELTSNYVVRYRTTLRERGQWRLLDSLAAAPRADWRVVPASRVAELRGTLGEPVFLDRRFAAYRAVR